MAIVFVITVSLLIGLFPTLQSQGVKRTLTPMSTPIPLQDLSIPALKTLLIPDETGAPSASIILASPSPASPIVVSVGTDQEIAGGTSMNSASRSTASALTEVSTRPGRMAPTLEPATPSSATVSSAMVRMPLLLPVQQVARAEATLQTGAFDVIISYDGADQTTSSLRFDLNPPQRFAVLTTYRSAAGSHTVETIAIGDRSWQRAGTVSWMAGKPDETLAALVQAFLPRIPMAADVVTEMHGALTTLSWYDADRNADMRLDLDMTTGAPRQLVQRSRGDATLVTVLYRGWNTAVSIAPPLTADATAPARS